MRRISNVGGDGGNIPERGHHRVKYRWLDECAMRKGHLGNQTDKSRGKEWKLASWLFNLFFF